MKIAFCVLALSGVTTLSAAAARSVPAGCDPSVMSEAYWNALPQEQAMRHRYWRRPSPGPVVGFLKAEDCGSPGSFCRAVLN